MASNSRERKSVCSPRRQTRPHVTREQPTGHSNHPQQQQPDRDETIARHSLSPWLLHNLRCPAVLTADRYDIQSAGTRPAGRGAAQAREAQSRGCQDERRTVKLAGRRTLDSALALFVSTRFLMEHHPPSIRKRL